MICPNPNCRKENPDDSGFCEYCGTRLDKSTCPYCGSEMIGNVKFCPSCGEDLRYIYVSFFDSDRFKRLVYAYITHDESGVKETPACVHYYSVFLEFIRKQRRLSWNSDRWYYKRFLSKMKKAINKYPKDIDSQCKFMARPWLYKR